MKPVECSRLNAQNRDQVGQFHHFKMFIFVIEIVTDFFLLIYFIEYKSTP